MIFMRPVALAFRISAKFGEWGALWNKIMEPNGKWVPKKRGALGQHKGIDFATPIGTEVFAMCDGAILKAGWENALDPKQGFGKRVRQLIYKEDGKAYQLVYAHLDNIYVKVGQNVKQGDIIGLTGNTGKTSGPHLHVEMIDENSQYVEITFQNV